MLPTRLIFHLLHNSSLWSKPGTLFARILNFCNCYCRVHKVKFWYCTSLSYCKRAQCGSICLAHFWLLQNLGTKTHKRCCVGFNQP